MPSAPITLRVNLRKLLVVLLLTVPLMVADVLWTVDRSRDEFTAASGRSLETVARVAASGAEAFVDAAFATAAEIAARPDVLALVQRQNRTHQDRTEVELAALDKVWQTPQAGPAVERIVASGEAIQLRAHALLPRRPGLVDDHLRRRPLGNRSGDARHLGSRH